MFFINLCFENLILFILILILSFQAKLFINKTIGELMFEGYEDELITIGDAFTEEKDKVIPMDKFGWFYKVKTCQSYIYLKYLNK